MHDHLARTAKIVGLGAYLPDTVLSDQDLEKLVDTSDEWIITRTGIRERRMVAAGETIVDLVERAGKLAMADARAEGRLAPGDLVLVSSFGGGLTRASALLRF